MNLDIAVARLNGLAWITLDGALDIASAPALRRALSRVPLDSTEVRVDLGGVTFLDSTGLSVLLSLANRAEEHGRRVTLVKPRAEVARLLWLVDVARRFEMVDVPPGVAAGA